MMSVAMSGFVNYYIETVLHSVLHDMWEQDCNICRCLELTFRMQAMLEATLVGNRTSELLSYYIWDRTWQKLSQRF